MEPSRSRRHSACWNPVSDRRGEVSERRVIIDEPAAPRHPTFPRHCKTEIDPTARAIRIALPTITCKGANEAPQRATTTNTRTHSNATSTHGAYTGRVMRWPYSSTHISVAGQGSISPIARNHPSSVVSIPHATLQVTCPGHMRGRARCRPYLKRFVMAETTQPATVMATDLWR